MRAHYIVLVLLLVSLPFGIAYVDTVFLIDSPGTLVIDTSMVSERAAHQALSTLFTNPLLAHAHISFHNDLIIMSVHELDSPLQVHLSESSVRVVPRPQSFIVQLHSPPLAIRSAGELAVFDDIFFEQDVVLEEISSQLHPGALTLEVIEPKSRFVHSFNGFELELSLSEARLLSELDSIKSITPNNPVRTLLQDAVEITNTTAAWMRNATLGFCGDDCLTGQGITVGVIDTGIDYTHPFFGGCTHQEFSEGSCSRVIGGRNLITSGPPMDYQGHGTHVAGIVGARYGDAPYTPEQGDVWGVAPDVTFFAYKSLDDFGGGSEASVIAGIEAAIEDEVDVIVMSLGGSGGPDSPMSLAVDAAVASGVVAVVAAGNNFGLQSISSPGTARSAITVGATDLSDRIAQFSSKGPVLWSGGFLNKPDVVAPGVDVCSAATGSIDGDDCAYRSARLNGTSMATPIVGGLAALLLQQDPSRQPSDIKSLITSSAHDVSMPPYYSGSGRVDTMQSLEAEIVVTGDLSFGIINSSATRSILIRSIVEYPLELRVDHNVTWSFFSNSTVPSSTQFVQDVFTLHPGEEVSIDVSVDALAPTGVFTGFLHVESEVANYRVPYAYANLVPVTLTVEDDLYPSYRLVSDDFSVVVFADQSWDFFGSEVTLLVPEGLYHAIAMSDFVIPGGEPFLYPGSTRYIISQDVLVTEPTSVLFRVQDHDVFTIRGRSFEDESLALHEVSYGYVLQPPAHLNSDLSPGRMLSYSRVLSGDIEIVLSETLASDFQRLFIFQSAGGVS